MKKESLDLLNYIETHDGAVKVKDLEKDCKVYHPARLGSLCRGYEPNVTVEDKVAIITKKGKQTLKDEGFKVSNKKAPEIKKTPQSKSQLKLNIEPQEIKGEVKKELEKLVPTDVPKYYERTLCNGDKDIATLIKIYQARPRGYPQHVLLQGPTGSGKTHALKVVAKELGIPLVRINMNRSITVEDFVGQFVPEENGGFRWQDGIVPRLMKYGGLLIIDEINAAPPEILFVLQSVLDFREMTLTQKDGEVIKACSDFWVVACMNPDYYGTEKLNESLKDKFGIILNYPYKTSIERKLIKNAELHEIAKKLRKMFDSPTAEIRTPISTRMLIQFQTNFELYGIEIAKQSFVNKFEREERRAVEEILELHFGKIKDQDEDEEEEAESNIEF